MLRAVATGATGMFRRAWLRLPALACVALLALGGCSRSVKTAQPASSPTVMGARVSGGSLPGPITANLPDAAGVEVVAGAGAVWVAGAQDLVRIDPATNRVAKTIDLGGIPTALGFGGGAVWATTFRQAATLEQELVRVDPATDAVTLRIPAADVVQDLAVSDAGVWLLIGGDLDRPAVKLVHVDPATGTVASTVELKNLSSLFVRVVAGPEGAFVMSGGSSPTVTHVHPDNRRGATVRLPASPSGGMVYASGAVWLVNRDKTTITKVDAQKDQVVATYPLPPLPAYLAEGGGRLWVTLDPTSVAPIDPASGAVGPVVTVDAQAAKDQNTEKRIKAIAVEGDSLWAVTAVGAWRVDAAG
jgi:hypothetical protein